MRGSILVIVGTYNMEQKPIWLVEHEESDNRQFGEIRDSLERIEHKLDPLTEAYNATIFAKKFLVGVGAVVLSIAAIGGGIMWMMNSFKIK